ncbi:MAG: NADH-quinone oxidoreductase subunit NuoK [Nitrososphaerota archaeon]|nr:NADH-quinone oxidoreductase subunit NuoK [Nitrososphaerota archaeon]
MNGLVVYIAASTVFLAIGVYGLLSKRNAIRIMFAIEIIINAANLNIAAFARYMSYDLGQAQAVATFVIALAAAEAAVGLAIIIEVFRLRGRVDVDEMKEMKG